MCDEKMSNELCIGKIMFHFSTFEISSHLFDEPTPSLSLDLTPEPPPGKQ